MKLNNPQDFTCASDRAKARKLLSPDYRACREPVRLHGGPFDGETVWLDCDQGTGPFVADGWAGWYKRRFIDTPGTSGWSDRYQMVWEPLP